MPAKRRNLSRTARFAKGDRVRLSEIGQKRKPWLSHTSGTVTGFTLMFSGCRVLMDGSKRPTLLHETYLESGQTEDEPVTAAARKIGMDAVRE